MSDQCGCVAMLDREDFFFLQFFALLAYRLVSTPFKNFLNRGIRCSLVLSLR